MPDTARSRTGLQASLGTDTINTVDDTLIAAFNKLETDMAIDGQGALSALPTSTVGTPGKRGRYYFATDTKQLFRDNGTGWDEIATNPAVQPWQTLSLAGGTWTGTPDGLLRFHRDSLGDSLGTVRIAAHRLVTPSSGTLAAGTNIAIMPVGYRPATATIYVPLKTTNPADGTVQLASIGINGQIILLSDFPASTAFVFLNVNYRTS